MMTNFHLAEQLVQERVASLHAQAEASRRWRIVRRARRAAPAVSAHPAPLAVPAAVRTAAAGAEHCLAA